MRHAFNAKTCTFSFQNTYLNYGREKRKEKKSLASFYTTDIVRSKAESSYSTTYRLHPRTLAWREALERQYLPSEAVTYAAESSRSVLDSWEEKTVSWELGRESQNEISLAWVLTSGADTSALAVLAGTLSFAAAGFDKGLTRDFVEALRISLPFWAVTFFPSFIFFSIACWRKMKNHSTNENIKLFIGNY